MGRPVPVECTKLTNSLADRTEVYMRKELRVVQITSSLNSTNIFCINKYIFVLLIIEFV